MGFFDAMFVHKGAQILGQFRVLMCFEMRAASVIALVNEPNAVVFAVCLPKRLPIV